jgi:hypothetical protein
MQDNSTFINVFMGLQQLSCPQRGELLMLLHTGRTYNQILTNINQQSSLSPRLHITQTCATASQSTTSTIPSDLGRGSLGRERGGRRWARK